MTKKNLISVCLLLVFVVLAVGSVPSDTSVETDVKSSSSTDTVTVSAVEIMNAYDANKVAADAKYEGKTIEVTGTIDSIGKDILDDMYVALKTNEAIFCVQCFFADSHQDVLSGLSKGQTVTIRGKCDGSMGNVIVRGCVLAD